MTNNNYYIENEPDGKCYYSYTLYINDTYSNNDKSLNVPEIYRQDTDSDVGESYISSFFNALLNFHYSHHYELHSYSPLDHNILA